jgi:hypothetical protein
MSSFATPPTMPPTVAPAIAPPAVVAQIPVPTTGPPPGIPKATAPARKPSAPPAAEPAARADADVFANVYGHRAVTLSSGRLCGGLLHAGTQERYLSRFDAGTFKDVKRMSCLRHVDEGGDNIERGQVSLLHAFSLPSWSDGYRENS